MANVSLPQLLTFILFARATKLISFSVAGPGFLEGSLAFFLPLVGGTAELGLGVAIPQIDILESEFGFDLAAWRDLSAAFFPVD